MAQHQQDKIIKFALMSPDAKFPTRANADDAGFDLYAAESLKLHPRGVTIISTDVQVQIPKGFVGMVCPRSGLAAKYGVTVVNAPGIIDSGYRGPIKVILTSKVGHEVVVGDRIAQLVIVSCLTSSQNVAYIDDETDRGVGGLGSSGK